MPLQTPAATQAAVHRLVCCPLARIGPTSKATEWHQWHFNRLSIDRDVEKFALLFCGQWSISIRRTAHTAAFVALLETGDCSLRASAALLLWSCSIYLFVPM